MDWQQIISLGIVALTAFLLVRSLVQRSNRTPFGFCEDDCGCSASDLVKKIPADRLKQLKEQQRRNAASQAKESRL